MEIELTFIERPAMINTTENKEKSIVPLQPLLQGGHCLSSWKKRVAAPLRAPFQPMVRKWKVYGDRQEEQQAVGAMLEQGHCIALPAD